MTIFSSMDVIREAPLAALLDAAIDYAGLFPPAALPMDRAIIGYLQYRESPDAWALGHFIAPAARLDELLAALPPGTTDITVSATIGADLEADCRQIDQFNRAGVGRRNAVVAAEAKVNTAADVVRLAELLRNLSSWYGEVALSPAADAVLDALKSTGARAKVRMGGVTPDAFPAPDAVARFLMAVASRSLRFKATAGLHHPIRGRYRLTYAPDAPTGTMFGYLNLLAATHLALSGATPAEIEAALVLDGPGTFRRDRDSLTWPGGRIDEAAARELRHRFFGFGSCSFREPIDELLPATHP